MLSGVMHSGSLFAIHPLLSTKATFSQIARRRSGATSLIMPVRRQTQIVADCQNLPISP